MNVNIKLLLKENFPGFISLMDLGIINKDVAYNAIIEERNPRHIISFAMKMKDDVEKVQELEDLLIEIGDLKALCEFATDVNTANLGKIRDIILTKNNPECICLFYQKVFQFNTDLYEHVENFDKLEKAICDSRNPDYIYRYTNLFIERNYMDIISCPSKYQSRIDRFADGIIATKNLFFIKKFINTPKIARFIDIVKFRSVIREIEEHNYEEYFEEHLRNSGIENPDLIELLKILHRGKTNSIMDNKDKFSKLFQDDKGVGRKLEKQ